MKNVMDTDYAVRAVQQTAHVDPEAGRILVEKGKDGGALAVEVGDGLDGVSGNVGGDEADGEEGELWEMHLLWSCQ